MVPNTTCVPITTRPLESPLEPFRSLRLRARNPRLVLHLTLCLWITTCPSLKPWSSLLLLPPQNHAMNKSCWFFHSSPLSPCIKLLPSFTQTISTSPRSSLTAIAMQQHGVFQLCDQFCDTPIYIPSVTLLLRCAPKTLVYLRRPSINQPLPFYLHPHPLGSTSIPNFLLAPTALLLLLWSES